MPASVSSHIFFEDSTYTDFLPAFFTNLSSGKIKEESDDEFDDQVADNFDGMGLRPELLRGVYAYGLERPSAVQQRTIISIVQGRNVIAQAPPGTGQTATFVIPVLQRLDTSSKFNQVLILTNTSELAAEIQKEVLSIGRYMDAGCYAYIDSTNIREDIPRLREGVQVVVGTPARVWDMIQRHALNMADISMFCLYDANELLSPSFRDQVMKIFQLLAKNAQVIFLAATEPTDALKAAEASIPDAFQILAKGDKLTLEGVKQFYIPIKKEGQRLVTLCKLYEIVTKAVVFCNSKRAAGLLTAAMNGRKLAVLVIHGKVEREQCAVVMKEFLSGPSRILITTDRYARIIDEQQVSVVINYDIPYPKKYIPRVGHGGQPGNNRIAINLTTDKDIDRLREIERFYNIEIDKMPQNFTDVFPTTQHQALDSSNVKIEGPHSTTTTSPTPKSTDISPLPFAVHVPETGDPDITNRREDFTAQSLQAQLLATAHAEIRSLQARVDLLTDRLKEETRRADQVERLADEAQSQLEAFRLESGHRNKRYCSPRHHD